MAGQLGEDSRAQPRGSPTSPLELRPERLPGPVREQAPPVVAQKVVPPPAERAWALRGWALRGWALRGCAVRAVPRTAWAASGGGGGRVLGRGGRGDGERCRGGRVYGRLQGMRGVEAEGVLRGRLLVHQQRRPGGGRALAEVVDAGRVRGRVACYKERRRRRRLGKSEGGEGERRRGVPLIAAHEEMMQQTRVTTRTEQSHHTTAHARVARQRMRETCRRRTSAAREGRHTSGEASAVDMEWVGRV